MTANCFQAEQEVHRDLCNLALPGLHVHSPLPTSHRPQWDDLCRGRPFCDSSITITLGMSVTKK